MCAHDMLLPAIFVATIQGVLQGRQHPLFESHVLIATAKPASQSRLGLKDALRHSREVLEPSVPVNCKLASNPDFDQPARRVVKPTFELLFDYYTKDVMVSEHMPVPHDLQVSKMLLTASSGSRAGRKQQAFLDSVSHISGTLRRCMCSSGGTCLLKVTVGCRQTCCPLMQEACPWQLRERQVVTAIWENIQQLLSDKIALNSTLRWVACNIVSDHGPTLVRAADGVVHPLS